jgi:P27 family predicted phage terminase small subunit
MAGTGPPPKPVERRQRRNVRTTTERAGAGLVALPDGQIDAPPAPSGLLKATREDWATFWASPLGSLVVPADFPALRRLFCLYDERFRAYRGLRQTGRLVETEKGSALNPLASYLKGIDAEVRLLEDRFGLSPIARLRLGVALGEAAKSLEELNRSLDADDDDHDDADPRRRVVESAALPGRRVVAADAGPEDLPARPSAAGSRRG